MWKFSRQKIKTEVRSLCWMGDLLVDIADGFKTIKPDGSVTGPSKMYAYRFDQAVLSPTNEFAAICERCGTKGLLLEVKTGKIIREINRSFYQAHVYDYPLVLFRDPEDRDVIAHCPDEYCQIEIEDIRSGERLTKRESKKPNDFFHSRLQVSPDGAWLMSAGWVWHPWDGIMLYNIKEALSNPSYLDTDTCLENSACVCFAEQSSACFLDERHILIGSSDEPEDPEEVAEMKGVWLRPRSIASYDFETRSYLWNTRLDMLTGTMMPVDENHVLAFYKYPRLIETKTGRLVHAWEDLACGEQCSSIRWGKPSPPLALDRANARFAVADKESVTIVQLRPKK